MKKKKYQWEFNKFSEDFKQIMITKFDTTDKGSGYPYYVKWIDTPEWLKTYTEQAINQNQTTTYTTNYFVSNLKKLKK